MPKNNRFCSLFTLSAEPGEPHPEAQDSEHPQFHPVRWSSPLDKVLHSYSMDCRAAALARAKTSSFFK